MRWSLLVAVIATAPAMAGEVLTNYDALCSDTGALGPAPGEESHLAVTRLVTGHVPFEVTQVRVRLHHGSVAGAMCDASGAHQIHLWTSTEESPEASPSYDATLTFSTEETLGEERLLEAELDSPIVISEGEYLWVALDFGGEHPNVGCVKTCRFDAQDGQNFWSNDAAAPYAWSDLASTSANGNLWIEVSGNPPDGVLPAEELPAEAPTEEAVPDADSDTPTRRRGRGRRN